MITLFMVVPGAKGESPVLTRTDAAVGMVANVGVDGQIVRNDFDKAGIYREMHKVTDDLGQYFCPYSKVLYKKSRH